MAAWTTTDRRARRRRRTRAGSSSWPEAGRTGSLAALAIGAAAGIELLQWLLPLGRVVSPLDAALNAGGAVAAGLLVREVRRATAGTLGAVRRG